MCVGVSAAGARQANAGPRPSARVAEPAIGGPPHGAAKFAEKSRNLGLAGSLLPYQGQTLTPPSHAQPADRRVLGERPAPANTALRTRATSRPAASEPVSANEPIDAKSSAEPGAYFAPRLPRVCRGRRISEDWATMVLGCKGLSSPHRCFTSSPGSFCIPSELLVHV